MLSTFFQTFFFRYGYPEQVLMTTAYFAFLYFGIGWVYWKCCRIFTNLGWMEQISPLPYSREQKRYELRQSFYSILVFGFSALPLSILIREGYIRPGAPTLPNIALGIALLTFWNEIHFYTVHRVMHLPWMMRHVHRVHHRSVRPSVFSVYSFHPLEAFLLSTVLVTIAPFYPFPLPALMLFPLVSILINFSGHSNYRLILKSDRKWLRFASRHNEHHVKAGSEYGFMTGFMDRIFSRKKSPGSNQTQS